MTPEQREAAITLMVWGMSGWSDEPLGALGDNANAALDALLSRFVVLSRDDVETEVERAHIDFRDDGPWQIYSATSQDFPLCERTITHHATRWEPTP